ncbi:MAG: RNA-binding transcriptional accessory protein [Saprospiraceae bacterium]|nr:RNA-binding transcriptional accessory protein [Saprospiraceae bacterium]
MTQNFDARIASHLNLGQRSVTSVVQLFEDGASIPFIARYRKEATGGLDEVALQKIQEAIARENELMSRKESILNTIESQGLLSDSLAREIRLATELTILEDLYLPYKKKRKTRASLAKELGLEELAEQIAKQQRGNPESLAQKFLTREVKSIADALKGAADILSEQIAELPWVRQSLRNVYQRHGILKSTVITGKEKEAIKFRDYFESEERISRCPSHRLLAILRGEQEGFLRVRIAIDQERSLQSIKRKLIRNNTPFSTFLDSVVDDSFKRLIAPSLENETRNYYKEKADRIAIDIFAKNLKQLLLAAPLGEKNVLAIDPGFRTGCKVVALNSQGELLHNTTIFPHPPQNESQNASKIVAEICNRFSVEAIAIGNGTAGRETMHFVNSIFPVSPPEKYLVNENGASIYSASEIARNEFPDHDITVRGAVSIGRRLMDPLAELVKIDAKSIGVGQYQHDVNQKLLKESLDQTVSHCVNLVGVNLNTASAHLLQHISGLGPGLAQNIIEYRRENGAFTNRLELNNVPRLGNKAFEQCAGFLRIKDGKNPLDDTAVHPESYSVVKRMAAALDCSVPELIESQELRQKIDLTKYISGKVGLPTLQDIMDELEKPGLDPRGKARVFEFHPGIKTIDDLQVGMELPAMVTNLTNFGAFVNLGIKQDGLIHISQMGSSPAELHIADQIYVKVTGIDIARSRIQLTLLGKADSPAI